jgi:hypothetical protein
MVLRNRNSQANFYLVLSLWCLLVLHIDLYISKCNEKQAIPQCRNISKIQDKLQKEAKLIA